MTAILPHAERLLPVSIHILHTKDDKPITHITDKSIVSIHILHTKDDYDTYSTIDRKGSFNPHPSYEG